MNRQNDRTTTKPSDADMGRMLQMVDGTIYLPSPVTVTRVVAGYATASDGRALIPGINARIPRDGALTMPLDIPSGSTLSKLSVMARGKVRMELRCNGIDGETQAAALASTTLDAGAVAAELALVLSPSVRIDGHRCSYWIWFGAVDGAEGAELAGPAAATYTVKRVDVGRLGRR